MRTHVGRGAGGTPRDHSLHQAQPHHPSGGPFRGVPQAIHPATGGILNRSYCSPFPAISLPSHTRMQLRTQLRIKLLSQAPFPLQRPLPAIS
jgi:hypothetical protein